MTPTLLLIIALVGSGLGQQQQQLDLANTVKLLQEQVNALLLHRQQDYNALEQSLKQSIEKNTELIVLRNEIKQLRKEMSSLAERGSENSVSQGLRTSPSGNEMKNERLRVRWLGSAVNELRTELSQVLRACNASEELAERSRLSSGIQLLRSDVSDTGRVVHELATRLTKLEAGLTSIRLDVVAGKERRSQPSDSHSCAVLSDQLSGVQLELESLSLRCEAGCGASGSHHRQQQQHRQATKSAHRRLEERIDKIERKIGLVSRKRGHLLEIARAAVGSSARLTGRLELVESRLSNASSVGQLLAAEGRETLRALAANQTQVARSLGQLELAAARQAADIGAGREELASLKRTVQALSVSASKLQERSEQQRASIDRLRRNFGVERLGHELERVEDEYRSMVDGLPVGCEAEREGLSLLAPGPGAPMLAACRKGGWILVGRRTDGSLDFDRSWDEYARGFGSPLAEFWAGNEALHRLSRGNCTRLRVELVDIEDNRWLADYEDFAVGSEDDGYRLRVSGYSGNATDAMSYQNDMAFSAKDRDMDISSTDCAANYHGGWWFSHCQHANLNGRYSLGLTWYRSDTNQWMAIASAELSLQRKEHCSHRLR